MSCNQVDASDAQPLYQQILDIIKKDIEEGVYREGQKIPTEAELSKLYGVSRVTVRNALERLAQDNYLVRYRGRGTYVSSNKYLRPIAETLGFTDMCHELGVTPGAKTIRSTIEPATQDDMEELGLEPGARIILIERIRYVDGVPVSVESCRFTERYAFLIEEDLNQRSMYALLREKYGITFGPCRRRIEITFATYQTAKYLGVSAGYPLLTMSAVICDSNDVPASRDRQFILGDKFALTV